MQESNYDILGISEIASKKEIHEAFRRLALLHHADRGGNEEEFKKIKQSYDDIKQGKKYPDNNAEKKHKSLDIRLYEDGHHKLYCAGSKDPAQCRTANRQISKSEHNSGSHQKICGFI